MVRRRKHRPERLSDWHRVKRTLQEGRVVQARVEAHEGFGAICSVGEGRRRVRATVRKHELSWDPDEQNLGDLPIGSSFEAIVIGVDEQWRELRLSKKAAEPSPIVSFAQTHKVGDVVDCEVRRLAPRVVVVRLPAGLEGEIPWNDVPKIKTPPEENVSEPWQLVVGDQVKAAIRSVNVSERKVRLSIVAAVNQLTATDRANGQALRRQQSTAASSDWTASPSDSKKWDVPPRTKQLSVLFVEDEPDIRDAIVGLLLDRRHLVQEAASHEGARNHLRSRHFDIIVVDLHLAGESAADLIQLAIEQNPSCRVVATSANYESLDSVANPEHVTKLPKPYGAQEMLATIEDRESYVPQVLPIDEGLENIAQSGANQVQVISSQSWHVIEEYLESVRRIASPCCVAMLSHSAATNQVCCLRTRGLDAKIFEGAVKTLRHSPIGDVLDGSMGGGELCEVLEWPDEDEDHGFQTNKEVIRAIGSRRFVGIPLEINTQSDAIAIFVFFRDSRSRLTQDEYREIHHLTRSLALELDRSALDAQLLRQQRSLSVGGLMLGMTHELRNAVSAIKTQAEFLQSTVTAIREGKKTIDDLESPIESFERQSKLLEDSFESLLSLSRKTTTHLNSVEKVVHGIVEQCIHTADQSNVLLVHNLHDLPSGTHQVPNSVSQILLNLVLNAIQHIRVYRKQDGRVEINVSVNTERNENRCVIQVSDNGFGLDWNHREKLFDMFVTTRKHGSGLGLYISRLIADSLDGHLEVESSFKFFGTTFCLEVPIA
ncbi:MAG: ATP-binding protein [Planctomycetota bacterium]